MSALAELTSLLWWLMLLSSTAIILHDIGGSVLGQARRPKMVVMPKKASTTTEDDVNVLAKRIRRAVQRPASFRTLQRDVAQTIVQTALAMKGYSIFRIPESRPELVNQILRDQDLIRFVSDHVPESSARKALIPRGEMLSEFEKTIRLLEKAESELK